MELAPEVRLVREAALRSGCGEVDCVGAQALPDPRQRVRESDRPRGLLRRDAQFRISGVQPSLELYSILLAAGASLGSGLFFGTYPAMRAARLRPIEALRFE